MSKRSLKVVSRHFQRCFMEVLRVFQGGLRSVPRDPKGYIKEVQRLF